MSQTDTVTKKPRLVLRIFIVLLLIAAMVGGLGYKKFLQLEVMTAQGSVAPPPISVTVAEAKAAQWNKRIKAIGTLIAYQGVNISSEVSGIVTSINFDSGQEVKKGKLLIVLDNQTEVASLKSAKAQFEVDNNRYQRFKQLKDENFVTGNVLDEQVSLVDISKSQISIAEAALAKKNILAPFSGKLGIRQVDLGQYIAPGTNMVTLQSVDRLLLDFTLPESNFRNLAVGQSVSFDVRSYPNRSFTGKITAWDPILDENTRNVNIRAEVDNEKRYLAPGMFAEILVSGTRKIPVLTIPETSIFYNIYGEAVYVLEQPEATESNPDPGYILAARQVDVAYRVAGVAGIKTGIKAGDLVVTAGQLKLYPSLQVAIVDDVPEFKPSSQ
ncbi:MAG: efflux RND transporter periplasmic adaptor subunit [Gammaproteobacteria bacterium]|nr:efflux RND transporter periplasmic adaptor subunit [Gammaproteobacteria bacterium]